MKRLIYLFIALLPAITFVSCSDDDKDKTGLEIVSAEVAYDATGGSGVIQVSSPTAITARSSEPEWCTVTASGSRIAVQVAQNDSLQNRTAAVHISNASGETTYVSVTQQGTIASIGEKSILFPFQGATREIPVTMVGDVKIEQVGDWFSYTVGDGVLVLTVPPHTDRTSRTGSLSLVRPSGPDQILLLEQWGYVGYEDLLGTWTMSSLDFDGLPQTTVLTFTENVNGSSYYVSGLLGTLQATFEYDLENNTFSVVNGNYMGRNGLYYVYIAFVNDEQVTVASLTLTAPFVSRTGNTLVYEFQPVSGWTGFSAAAFTQNSFTSAYYAGSFATFNKPVLTKVLQ